MAKVYLICGKLCSGKSWYARRLREEKNAVILSCDELAFALFDGDLGREHDVMMDRIKRYFFNKSLEIVRSGTSVILEWGFWTAAWRRDAHDFYETHGVPCEMHYIEVDQARWRRQIELRNEEVRNGLSDTYIVDAGLLNKLERMFEPPQADEIDVRYFNTYED